MAGIPLLIRAWQLTANERARSGPLVEHTLAGGWQSEAALAFGFGFVSFANPSIPASAGRLWGGLAMVWAIAFVGLSHWVWRRTRPSTSRSQEG